MICGGETKVELTSTGLHFSIDMPLHNASSDAEQQRTT